MVRHAKVFYVNGYGIPADILADANYIRYLRQVMAWAETAEADVAVFFAGGATDPRQPDRTEAGEMRRLAETLLPEHARPHVRFESLAEGKDLLANFRALARHVFRDTDVVVFCEHARQDRVRFLCWRFFREATVVPVAFDEGMGHPLLARLRQLPETALLAGSWLSPLFKRLVFDPLRKRHMDRDSARRHARSSS